MEVCAEAVDRVDRMKEEQPKPQSTATRYCPDCGRLWESLYTVPVLPGTVPEQPCPNCYRIEMEEQE